MNCSTRNKKVVFSAVVLTLLALAACGSSKMQGTYSSNDYPVVLDLRPWGKASLTLRDRSVACTYQVNGKTLDLTVDRTGRTFHLDVLDDGSLHGTDALSSLWGVLRKSKS